MRRCFYGLLGGARHAHLRRSSAGLVAHGLWSFLHGAHGIFENFFMCGVGGTCGCFCGLRFSGVGMGVSEGVTE